MSAEQLASEVYTQYSRLLARNLGPAYALLRAELAKPEYQGLDDASAWWEINRPRGPDVELDPIPVQYIRSVLSQIAFLAALAGDRPEWERIAASQTALLAGVTEVPRHHIVSMVEAAVRAGVLVEQRIGVIQQTPLQRLGLAGLIDSPIHLSLARNEVAQ